MIDKFCLAISTDAFNFIEENSSKNSFILKIIKLENLYKGLSIVINTSSILLLLYLFSNLLNLQNMFLTIRSFAILRLLTGGIHIRSNELCIIASVITFIAISFISIDYPTFIILSCISFILVFIFAPSNIPQYAKIFVKFSSWFKLIALLLIIINIFYVSHVVCIAFFIQSLTLISKNRGFINE